MVDTQDPNLYLESLGVSESEKAMAVDLARRGAKMDPVVSALIAATNGIAYKHLVGADFDYPIPDIRLSRAEDTLLLDIGCGWGRWSVAAARKGYRVVGIDPSLSAVMAGKRVAKQLSLAIDYICADARHLPFEDNSFDTVFSYSVIQHFSKIDAARTLEESCRILRSGGRCLIQMPNRLGLRSLLHLCIRRFAKGSGFDVRYWSIDELHRTFERLIGPSEISVHCYFGLGLEPTDLHLMPRGTQLAINLSERLRKLSAKASWMTNFADSVYVSSVKER
jgi:ubiquinone/menaquinone biosynthesis C-methylase UbiE